MRLPTKLPRLPYSRCCLEPVPGARALDARAVTVRYLGLAEPALVDVHWCVPCGARAALVGPNGSGKSTLLKTVAGLLPFSSGEVQVYGRMVGACQHRVAYLPQRLAVDWRFPMSVRRLVLAGRYVHLGWLRRPSERDWEIVDEMLARVRLADLADRQIGELSGGQQQRALLARTLAQEADLLLLDEPLNAVDAQTRSIFDEVCDELRRAGKTLIMATHDIVGLEKRLDDILSLCAGRARSAASGRPGIPTHGPNTPPAGASSTLASPSIVAPFFTRLPRNAALPIEATSAVGVASTITQGQKTISIVIARRTSPLHHQSRPPRASAIGVYSFA
jgi:ABC-type Mn2+/Zn2+ transport system ATPase subunit